MNRSVRQSSGWFLLAVAASVLAIVSCSAALRSCSGRASVAALVSPSVAQAEAVAQAFALRSRLLARGA